MKTRFMIIILISFLVSCNKDNSEPVLEPLKPESISFIKYMNYFGTGGWKIASTPVYFTESSLISDLTYGFNRAKITWYIIDSTVFYDPNNSHRPVNITNEELSNHFVRQILETEVFPDKDVPNELPKNLSVFNINYFPDEKGPYNYDALPSAYSNGIDSEGHLVAPETRWGGIMMRNPLWRIVFFHEVDFHYLDFWLMDPFIYSPELTGDIFINLGTISEDVLRDGLLASEVIQNGNEDTTAWGVFSTDISPENNDYYDTGLDRLLDEEERVFFSGYVEDVQSICTQETYQSIFNDPSGDDYHHFTGDDYDVNPLFASIINRYKKYNSYEGNSYKFILFPDVNYYIPADSTPNSEDINSNSTLTTQNAYLVYRIHVNQVEFTIGLNYIVNILEATGIPLVNGETGYVKWYHFKIPFEDYTSQVGNIVPDQNFETIRIWLTGFSSPVVLRFASLDLKEK